MSTFYVLPPREVVEHWLAALTEALLPGLPTGPHAWASLVAALTAGRDAFVVHREELPRLGDTLTDLIEGYGAEAGDRVVEVSGGGSRSYAIPQSRAAR